MRRKIGIISLIFLFLVLFAKSSLVFPQNFLTQEESACRYLDKGEIDEAIEILQIELKRFPDNFNAHLYLGIASYLKKNLEDAFQKFAKIEKEIDRKSVSNEPFGDKSMHIVMVVEREADVLFSGERKGLLYFCLGLTLKEKNDLKKAKNKFNKAL